MLREDLRLMAASPNRDGSPAWNIQDPVTNRFFRIGWLEFELLSRWHLGEPAQIARAVADDTGLEADVDTVRQLQHFLRGHHLLRSNDADGTDRLVRDLHAAKGSRAGWLLHNYLFFRLPLFKPARFLSRTQWLVGFIFTPWFLWLTVGVAAVGLMLASREWDTFIHTFRDVLSPAGLAGFAGALIVAKTLHELGHAYTATRYGVRVAHMGVAFLVMWPMLYTDTSESWKLADRGKRFRIAAAGVITEFALAGFATLAWSLTSEGDAKSAWFFLATTSWIITLGINASPFMRFDGYYLLSDALDIPNLHSRSFALTRAWMRRGLLGWDEPDPENFSKGLRRGLIAFSLLTWTYRLVVFLGIAVAVYTFFFKALGIFLFAVEISWFVMRPVYNELSAWAARRGEIKASRAVLLTLGVIGLVGFVIVPWRFDVRADGWLHAEQQQLIYSPLPARIDRMLRGGTVKAGDAIAVLDSPDTRSKANQSEILAAALSLELSQTVGRANGAERRNLLVEQLAQQRAESQSQVDELKRLELRAPFTGELLDVNDALQPGAWVNASQPMAMLVDPDSWVVEAFVEQREVERIRPGDPAKVSLRGHWQKPLQGHVVSVDSTRILALAHPMLAADHGGRIVSIKQADGQETPRDALYRVRIKFDDGQAAHDAFNHVTLASVRIEGPPRSIAAEAWRSLASIWVRESGF